MPRVSIDEVGHRGNDVLAHLIEDEAIEQAQIRLVSATRPRNVSRESSVGRLRRLRKVANAPQPSKTSRHKAFATEG